jgi:Dolichyl-phosphate-mannose-protein mannosyltransferase
LTAQALVIAFGESAVFALVALCAGEFILSRVERLLARAIGGAAVRDCAPSATRLGAALLVGFGAAGYVGVGLGLARIFSWISLLIAALLVLALGRNVLRRYAAAVRHLSPRSVDPHFAGGLGAVAILVFGNALAALASPTQPDELSYHLPQAEVIVHTHRLPLTLGGHYFYGNIPKLIEVLYAEALAVSDDFPLTHLVHLMIVLSFLIFLYGTIRRFFGRNTGLLAVLMVLLYGDFLENATTALIDAAGVGYEIGSLLAFASWLEERHPEDAARSALLIALALSVKYTSAPMLLFLAVALAIALFVLGARLGHRARFVAALAATVGVGCGFWYGKNAVRYGNPFYPLYFGHPGVSDLAYRGLLNDIQRFGPRTLHDFVRIPQHYAQLPDLSVFLSFYLAPFALLVGRARVIVRLLFAWFVLYTTYWFFLATHQTRFLMSAVVTAAILLAITLAHVRAVVPRLALVAAALAAIVFTNTHIVDPTYGNLSYAAKVKLRWWTWAYALGRETKTEYLQPYFGCHFTALQYLEQRHLQGNVVDNWTQWHDFGLTIYESGNKFLNFATTDRSAKLWADLRRSDFRYVYVRASMKTAFRHETDPQEIAYRDERLPVENTILHHAQPIWSKDDCRLYRIER